MERPSFAQGLSRDILFIVVRIIIYTGATKPVTSDSPYKTPILVPLLGVCRWWRHITCREFYGAAVLGVCEEPLGPQTDLLDMQVAIAAGATNYVTHLTILVETHLFDLGRFDDDYDPASFIMNMVRLPAVRSVHLVVRTNFAQILKHYIMSPKMPVRFCVEDSAIQFDQFIMAIRIQMPALINFTVEGLGNQVYSRLPAPGGPSRRRRYW